MNVKLLIDDSVENALSCASASPPVPVLLFGDYPWNQRYSSLDESKDHLGYEDRLQFEGGKHWWLEESVELPESVTRVKDWKAAVEYVKANVALK